MIKVFNVIGARPQIIKAAAISRSIKDRFSDRISEIVVHTGQHYDSNMSQVFIEEMQIPHPHYNLNAGSSSHGKQSALILEKMEELLLFEKPDYVILYGDTNSTLSGALAAAKLHIPIAHVEAGLRSFNKSMPEEINRIVCDHCSTLLFSPTEAGINNLVREGFSVRNTPLFNRDNPGLFHCGDVMYDNTLFFSAKADTKISYLEKHGLEKQDYILVTIHRDNNTDQPSRFKAILESLVALSNDYGETIVFPVHPRTLKMIEQNLPEDLKTAIESNPRIKLIPPASFLEMIILERESSMIFTDSGGVQKEAFFFRKPCIILRKETEWVEIVQTGAAALADASYPKILELYQQFKTNPPADFPEIFGDGHAAEFICRTILENVS